LQKNTGPNSYLYSFIVVFISVAMIVVLFLVDCDLYV
jgi:surface polysaccharide O-acyltransferase-like enzyme